METTSTSRRRLFSQYELIPSVYDEFFEFQGKAHSEFREIIDFFDELAPDLFSTMHQCAQELLRQRGVTFNVYADKRGTEKIFPFDLFPRLISSEEWSVVERGLQQRVQALNAFLLDIYGEQLILKDKRIPGDVILSSKGFIPQLMGITPPGNVYTHIAGIDLIRVGQGQFTVLEDNLKVPSGVSYVIENRNIMKQMFPNIFTQLNIRGVDDYPLHLRYALGDICTECDQENPTMVVLSPGIYNSAYFEHTFLARRMGCPLVQNNELVVEDEKVFLKTLQGLERVHIIYRRTDDDYIDPTVFNPHSLLGVPGLVRAYSKGNVVLANALGNGVADDKAIYPYVPEIIRYYLGEEPILDQVNTYSCTHPQDYEFIMENLSSLVIKVVNQSGGYGIVIGPQASTITLEEVRAKIMDTPRDYIAQPLKELSSCPTYHEGAISPRRIDFRPFVITGKSSWVLPGGLTRVALRENSYIVNSSQGGGSKDTWILGES